MWISKIKGDGQNKFLISGAIYNVMLPYDLSWAMYEQEGCMTMNDSLDARDEGTYSCSLWGPSECFIELEFWACPEGLHNSSSSRTNLGSTPNSMPCSKDPNT